MTRAVVLAVALWFPIVLLASGQSSNLEREISAALQRLLSRHAQTFPFVVVEHRPTGKYVQFGLADDVLFIDLPLEALSHDEQKRAVALFSGLHRQTSTFKAPLVGGGAKQFETLQADFGTDTASAARFARRVFTEVYLLPPDIKVNLEESNQNGL